MTSTLTSLPPPPHAATTNKMVSGGICKTNSSGNFSKHQFWCAIDIKQAPVLFGAERIVRIALPGLVKRLEEEHRRIGRCRPTRPIRG